MKKWVFSLLMALSIQASATDWSIAKAGAQAYVSADSVLGIFFYGSAGEELAFSTFSEDVPVFCGVASIDDSTNLFAVGNQLFFFRIPANNLYIAVCVQAGQQSGSVTAGVLNSAFFGGTRKSEHPDELSSKEQDILVEKLRSAIGQILKQ
jgi:hypothetical protein